MSANQEENLLNDYLGFDLVKIKEVNEAKEEEMRKFASAIVKLTEYPEWKVFADELKRLKENIDKPCEVYANKPNEAWVDTGIKRALDTIENFINSQHLIVDQYVKEQKEQKEQTSK